MASFSSFQRKLKVFFICYIFFHFQSNCSTFGFTCQIPDDWQSGSRLVQHPAVPTHSKKFASLNAHTGLKWPGGRVKYKLDKSLRSKDIKEVFNAFADYHTKTCIRFQPKQPWDPDYVNIEINETTCGYSNVCRLGGYQFAQFGQNCRNMNTMIHELGHSLCLGHEHQRQDRNLYLEFNGCPPDSIHPAQDYTNAVGLYDYQSVMHYGCGSCVAGWPTQKYVPKCGMDATVGLSILDADHINSLYNCQGCFRHRWRPLNQLTKKDKANIYSFGYETHEGFPMYPCRTLFGGQVVVGYVSFNEANPKCVITYSNAVYEIWGQVEVLTIPGGLHHQCYTYKLKSRRSAKLSDAIAAAAYNEDTRAKMYIAYGTGKTWDGATENTIGKVWAANQFESEAHLPIGSSVEYTMEYDVLTCSLDRFCHQ